VFIKLIKNSLIKNTAIFTLTNIINSAIPFFLLPILTRYLTPKDYGLISMFALLISFTTPFIGLNMHGAISRQYYNQEKTDIKSYIFNCLIISTICTLFISILFLLFANRIETLTSFPTKLLWIVIVYTYCQFIILITLTLWRVQNKIFAFGLFSNINTFSNVGLSILFIVLIKMDWIGRIYAQFLTGLIFSFFSIYFLFKKELIKVSFNKKYVFNALMFGIPLIPHALSGSIISMTDRLFIANMIGLPATGVYTVGYQVGSIINLLAMSFNNAYVPWLYQRLKNNSNSTKIKIVKFTYLYFFAIITLAILLAFLAPPILKILLGKSFNESSIYVSWIAMGYAFNGMYLMVVNYIFYSEKTKILAYITFSAALINILLNYLFIKAFGAIGAAQATTIVFAIKFFLVWFFSSKVQPMPWNLKKIMS
jgi:O-antigen/teichoic acid export membrane protein